MPSAAEIKQQIKALQSQLKEMEGDIQDQKLKALHQWMIEYFGRELKAGDVLTRREANYEYDKETNKGKIVSWKEIRIKVISPMDLYTNFGNAQTDISYIYWGHAQLSIKNLAKDSWLRDSISKTELKRYKLTSA